MQFPEPAQRVPALGLLRQAQKETAGPVDNGRSTAVSLGSGHYQIIWMRPAP